MALPSLLYNEALADDPTPFKLEGGRRKPELEMKLHC